MMVMMALLEKVGLELDDAVEVEGVAVQNLVERNGGVLRAVDLGIGVDGADAPFNGVQLLGASRGRSC